MILSELLEKLKQVEETALIDLLGLDSHMIVERFEDIVEERRYQLIEETTDEYQ